MSRSFLFTGKALRILFNDHTELFEPILLRRSPFKNREIAVANRRRIRHLVVVAGPTANGKSTLLARLDADPRLRAQLGLENANWVIAEQKTQLPTGQIDGLLLHYDLLRPYRRSMKTYARDPRCDFMEVADKITVITLMAPPQVLRQRLKSAAAKSLWRRGELSNRHRELYERYGEPEFLRAWYAQWFAFCDCLGDRVAERLLMISDGSGWRTASARNWQEEYARLA